MEGDAGAPKKEKYS